MSRADWSHSHNRFVPPHEQLFICIQCGLTVSCAPLAAGVINRNHCPICLWSRHMDWRKPGDRRSNCRAAMEPIGLTLKAGRNKYAAGRDGELMLVHMCRGCGVIVLNRIAADDDADTLANILPNSHSAQSAAADQGIELIRSEEAELVYRRIFGAAFVQI